MFEKSAMSGLVSSLPANLHFRRTLVSIELICAKYGASWWLFCHFHQFPLKELEFFSAAHHYHILMKAKWNTRI